MFIVCISQVKNEADIIEPFCRYNVQFFDLMIVIDNGSVDRTREIVLALGREGLPIVLADDHEFAFRQGERMTRAFRNLCRIVQPDFVMFLDADEFVRCANRQEFVEHLAIIPERGCGLVAWASYVCPPSPPDSRNPLRYMTRRLKSETRVFCKVIIRVPGARYSTISIAEGNHSISSSQGRIEHVNLAGMTIAHFPLRSPEQLATKAVVARMACVALSHGEVDENHIYQWHRLFHQLMTTGPPGWDALSNISISYLGERPGANYESDTLADPIKSPSELRYTSSGSDPLVIVARSWEAQLQGAQANDLADEISQKIKVKMAAARPWRRLRDAGSSRSDGTVFDPVRHFRNLYCDLPPVDFLFKKYRPDSVIDFGCGLGTRLMHAKRLGVTRVRGYRWLRSFFYSPGRG